MATRPWSERRALIGSLAVLAAFVAAFTGLSGLLLRRRDVAG